MNRFLNSHFVCDDCNNDFSSLSDFQLHIGSEQQEKAKNTGIKKKVGAIPCHMKNKDLDLLAKDMWKVKEA